MNEVQKTEQNQVAKKESNQMGFLSINELYGVAKVLALSTITPKEYQNNPANCFMALEMSQRIGASPMMVMQNLYNINGRPAWSSPFIISTINTCGRFKTPLQYELTGKGNTLACYAYAISKDGTKCIGPTITMAMAEAEGWLKKNGSKWQTMPEVMIRYRAAAFFGRQYAPELLMGMRSVEETVEIPESDITITNVEEMAKEEVKTNANTGEVVDIKHEEPKQETTPEADKKDPATKPTEEQPKQPEQPKVSNRGF